MLSKIVKGGLIFSLLFAFGIAASAQQTTTTQTDAAAPQTKSERKLLRQEGKRARLGKIDRQGGFGKGIRNLNLTDAQKEQFKALHQKFGEQFSAQRQELRTLAQKKHQGTLTADEQSRFDALRGEMKSQQEEMLKQMNTILTPEQIQQRDQMKEQMKQRRGEMRKRFQERRKQRPTTQSSDGKIIE